MKQLLVSDSYDTQEGQVNALQNIFPSLFFYANILKIVVKSGIMAKKGRYDSAAWVEGSIGTVRALEAVGVNVHVRGAENILKPEGPCVFIGNHMSTLETFVLPCLIQPHRDVTFVVKDSLMKYPYFKHVLASRNPIVVGRTSPKADLGAILEEGAERLSKGISVIVFPQSTRSIGFDPQQFNSAGVKLARKAGVPVVPVALRTDAWGMGKIIKDAGPVNPNLPVNFVFGEPIIVEGNGKAEHAHVCEFIKSRLEAWGLKSLPAAEERKALAGE